MAEELIANEEDRELASKPIPSLVRRYTIVTGQGMLAQIIMVILEGLVMGWGLGAHGLACVSIIMSAEFLNLAFGNLFGTGVPAIVGNLLGAGDVKGASKAFSQGFWLTSIVSIILAVIMAVFTEPICAFFGATPDIMADTVLGVRTFSILLPFTVVGQMVTAVMRVDEKVQIQANLMTVSAIIAIVWLALSTFIFKLGTMGAGIYYGLSIGIWAIGAFWFIGGKKSQLQIDLPTSSSTWPSAVRSSRSASRSSWSRRLRSSSTRLQTRCSAPSAANSARSTSPPSPSSTATSSTSS